MVIGPRREPSTGWYIPAAWSSTQPRPGGVDRGHEVAGVVVGARLLVAVSGRGVVIESLEDLAGHLERAAEAEPALAEESVLRPPGCSEDEIARLVARLPGLPESYLSVLRRFALGDVAIGYFVLSPAMSRVDSIVDALLSANGERNAFAEATAARRLFIVAAHDSDWLCVAGQAAQRPGEVWRIDLGFGPEPLFSRVANSYEQLLIGAGRLDEMAVGGAEGWLPVEDFVDAMRPLGLDDEQLGNWRFFAEAAFVGG
jgi:hypothetical protein